MEQPALLLVHGSWHGPWCWDRIIPKLDKLGCASRTVQLPSCAPEGPRGGPDADWAAVAAAAAAMSGPVIAVGHSYGGAVITAAEWPDNVVRLVYLGAFMPEKGQSVIGCFPPGPPPPYVALDEDGTSRAVGALAAETFYNTCSDADAREARARLVPQNAAVVPAPMPRANWHDIPATYVVLSQDHAIPPEMQAAFAAQAGDRFELDSDHSPFLCMPGALAELLARIAAAPPG